MAVLTCVKAAGSSWRSSMAAPVACSVGANTLNTGISRGDVDQAETGTHFEIAFNPTGPQVISAVVFDPATMSFSFNATTVDTVEAEVFYTPAIVR